MYKLIRMKIDLPLRTERALLKVLTPPSTGEHRGITFDDVVATLGRLNLVLEWGKTGSLLNALFFLKSKRTITNTDGTGLWIARSTHRV